MLLRHSVPRLFDVKRLFDLSGNAVLAHEIFEAILAGAFDHLSLHAAALRSLYFMIGLCGHKGKGFPNLVQQILIRLVILHHRPLELMVLHRRFLRRIINRRSSILPHDLLHPAKRILPVLSKIDRILEISLHNKNTTSYLYFIE